MAITRRMLLAAPAILAMTPAAAQAGKITLVVPFPGRLDRCDGAAAPEQSANQA
jgi:hypothetical protein